MKSMQESLDKLRADAAKFSMMSVLATDAQKREYFARLADHLNVLASEIARAIAGKVGDSTSSG
jgi:Mor family transcriptional regulator